MNAVATIDIPYMGLTPEMDATPGPNTRRTNDRTAAHSDRGREFTVAPQLSKEDTGVAPDETLMELIGRGDTQAFEELYDRYVRGCFGLAMKIVREPSIAEEVVQDVFMKLWSRPGVFTSDRGKFSSWLLTLVHNRSVDKLRRLKAGAAGPVLPLDATEAGETSLADLLADNAATPYDQAWTSEQGRIVREALKALPHPQRETILLAYFGGLTQKEIAERLQEPLGTVKTRTRAALHQLRRSLAGGGLIGDTV